jgi:hypothetical protein
MLSQKVTVVYATSPHRFGDDDCMINFSIETLRSFGFGGCSIIVCADGVNPHSNYATRTEKDKYKSYLQKLKDNLGEDNCCISDKHLGLTENYLQAWKLDKIKTENVFFMNHDAAILPTFLDIDIEKIIEETPDFVNTTIFPRDAFNATPGLRWWRAQSLESYSMAEGATALWRNEAKVAFGNQDHGCIIKKEFFPEYVNRFYNPAKTFFLEDSVQEFLVGLETTDIDSWGKFGGCVWEGSFTFHLDGQSKAGEEFAQEGGRKGEKIWSKGQLQTKAIRLAKFNPSATNELTKAANALLKHEEELLVKELWQTYQDLCQGVFHFHGIAKSKRPTNREKLKGFRPSYSKTLLPIEGKEYFSTVYFNRRNLTLRWKSVNDKKLILKLNAGDKRLLWGGHRPGEAELDYKDYLLAKDAILSFELFDHSVKAGARKLSLEMESFDIKLVSTDQKGNIYIKWKDPKGFVFKIFLKDSLGNVLEKGGKQGVYKYHTTDLFPSQWISGYFKAYKGGRLIGKTWNFCIPVEDYLVNTKDSAGILELLAENIENSCGVEPEFTPKNWIKFLQGKN